MKNSFCRHGSATSSTVHPCVIAWHTHTHTHTHTRNDGSLRSCHCTTMLKLYCVLAS